MMLVYGMVPRNPDGVTHGIIDGEADADLAVIARRKANERRHIAAIAGTIEYVKHRENLNDGRLPEAAFDWPIYRAALLGYDDEWLATDYELDNRAGDLTYG